MTNTTAEKLDILAYMIENGYSLMGHTMDEYCEMFSVEDLRRFCEAFMAWKVGE